LPSATYFLRRHVVYFPEDLNGFVAHYHYPPGALDNLDEGGVIAQTGALQYSMDGGDHRFFQFFQQRCNRKLYSYQRQN